MAVQYEEYHQRFLILEKAAGRRRLHVHKHFQFILVTMGEMDLGIGREFFHMEKGDFAIAFPDLLHRSRVPEKGRRRSIHILADPNAVGSEEALYTQMCPVNPVICADMLHPDIPYAMRQMVRERKQEGLDAARRALSQLILARAMPEYTMVEKTKYKSTDLTYRTVEYMATHFHENVSLESAAHALGCSKYVLSRVFSQSLDAGFNQYLNKLRLDQSIDLLLYTDYSITDICYLCGFESQRTFNRVFRAQMNTTPRAFRNAGLNPERADGNVDAAAE